MDYAGWPSGGAGEPTNVAVCRMPVLTLARCSRTASAANAACRPCCRRLLSRAFALLRYATRRAVASHRARSFCRVQADYLPVIKTKQRTAFPPNYIHSLDSAHMMLTAVACSKAGEHAPPLFPLTLLSERLRPQASRLRACTTRSGHMPPGAFLRIIARVVASSCRPALQRGRDEPVASRHGACRPARLPLHTPRLTRLHAPQFVQLHSEPLLQQLYESFRRDYPEVVFREPPRPGALRLEDVRCSPYFFS